jgi:trehalose synthase-fused probable maltokinase
MITIHDKWEKVVDGQARADLEGLLPAFLTSCRWFGGKAKSIRSAKFADILRVDSSDSPMLLGFVEVSYSERDVETYSVLMTVAFEAEADRIERDYPSAVIGPIKVIGAQGNHVGVLYDALWNEDCAYSILASMGQGAQFQGTSGTVMGSATALFDKVPDRTRTAPISVMKAEQSNTSVKFDDCVIMKLYRRVEPGINPELEIGRVLTARNFRHSPSLVGALEYHRSSNDPTTLVLAQTFVANHGNAWEYTLSQLSHYFDRVSSSASNNRSFEPDFVDAARLLGRRTGELHLALGETSDDPAFAAEVCSPSYIQSRVQAMQQSATHALTLLRGRLSTLSDTNQAQAHVVLEQQSLILERLESLGSSPITAMRIRCHGDYHLGQVLYTGEDFVIIDYEGEPARPLAERRAKHVPVVDLAGMVRSFHYAAHAALRQRGEFHSTSQMTQRLISWAEQWYQSARTAFLEGYHAIAGEAPFSPRSHQEFHVLLDTHLLDKALYELAYELNNRPDWVDLPLTGILQCMNALTAPSDRVVWGEQKETAGGSCATGQPGSVVKQ